MLSKLFKHEFLATARVQLPLIGAAAAATLLMSIFHLMLQALSSGTVMMTMMKILTTLFTFVYTIGFVAYVAAAHFIGIQRYYKNLFTDEGY